MGGLEHEFDCQWHIEQKRRYFGYDKYEKTKLQEDRGDEINMYSESGPFDFLYVLDLDNVKNHEFLFLIIAMIYL